MTAYLKQTLKDWRYMLQFLLKHPTDVRQPVMNYPAYVGYSDSSSIGTGGIRTSGMKPLDKFFWHLEWPEDIKDALIADKNPPSTI